MNCQQIQKLIHAHHDGELDVANTLQVDEHLADCPACFQAARQLSALSGALKEPALRQRLAALGAEPAGSSPEELARFVRAEYDKWGQVVREAGIRLD